MRARLSLLVALATALAPISVLAQAGRSRQASIALAEGSVYLNDVAVASDAATSELPNGALIRTAQGRAVVTLNHGGWLFLDANASVRVHRDGGYTYNRIEVFTGSAIVMSMTSQPLVDCENSIRLSDASVARFDVQPKGPYGERPCVLRVYEGAAAVPLISYTLALRPAQAITCSLRRGDMTGAEPFAVNQLDAFDQWARRTRDALRR